jgi:zinc and cadmium transporter
MPAFSLPSHALPAILLSALAAFSLILGAALPTFRSSIFEHRLTMLIGFSAGLMLATALFELVPQALERSPHYATWGVGVGFMVLYIAERITHFHACRHRQCDVEHGPDAKHDLAVTHPEPIAVLPVINQPPQPHSHAHLHAHTDRMAMVGMSIHNFADGLTAAAAFALAPSVGFVVVFAIVVHQMAAGLSLGAILLRMGRRHKPMLIATAIVASFIVWGAVFYLLVVPVGVQVQGVILGVAGGSFLYVAACDLLPEAHLDDEGWGITATTVLGFFFAVGTKLLFGG